MKKNWKKALSIVTVSAALIVSGTFFANQYMDGEGGGATIGSAEEVELSYYEKKTRSASLRVVTPTGGHGSGTLVKYKGSNLILTAAHVTQQGSIYLAIDQWGEQNFATLIYKDETADFAVLIVNDFEKTKPLKFKIPSYDIRDAIDLEVIFSGFPARHDLLTMRGTVAGYQGSSVIIHSSAWGGSSGSGVFDSSGSFVGILYAVSIGNGLQGPAIMENFIWIMPFDKINWEELDSVVESL